MDPFGCNLVKFRFTFIIICRCPTDANIKSDRAEEMLVGEGGNKVLTSLFNSCDDDVSPIFKYLFLKLTRFNLGHFDLYFHLHGLVPKHIENIWFACTFFAFMFVW